MNQFYFEDATKEQLITICLYEDCPLEYKYEAARELEIRKWRNLVPLCKEHHMKAHSDRQFADWLREEREKRFGSWYWADEYDLFKAGLIPNTTKEAFEKYMEGEEERARLARVATENHS